MVADSIIGILRGYPVICFKAFKSGNLCIIRYLKNKRLDIKIGKSI